MSTSLRSTQKITNALVSVARTLKAIDSRDGEGARVFRTIGTHQLSELQPFLLLDEYHVTSPGGFPNHPHRGFETITYQLGGAFKHKDNAGHAGTINAGDVQWMTAGRGIIHSEMPATSGDNWGLQLWCNLKAKDKMIPPAYQELTGDKLPQFTLLDGDVFVKIIAGSSHGQTSPITVRTSVKYIDVTLRKAGVQFVDTVPANFQGIVYVIEGQALINESAEDATLGKTLQTKGSAVFLRSTDSKDERNVAVTSLTENTRFVLIAGEYIDEPVARYGPFVMNTREEIQQAFEDYQDGKFTSK